MKIIYIIMLLLGTAIHAQQEGSPCGVSGEIRMTADGKLYGCAESKWKKLTENVASNAAIQATNGATEMINGVVHARENNGVVSQLNNIGFLPTTISGQTHEIGKIIYHQNHFWQGVANQKWHMIDNQESNFFDINPKNIELDYTAGTYNFSVLANNLQWGIGTAQYVQTSLSNMFSPNRATGTPNNGTVVYTYPENTGDAVIRRVFYMNRIGNSSNAKKVDILQIYKPRFLYSNIVDVHGKELSGVQPAAYSGKVNPGPERFFAWVSSYYPFRMRIKYNDAPPAGGFAHRDAVNGDYDYQYDGKATAWAYEYQLKENKTTADRKISLEISFRRMNGSWTPWEDTNIKNKNNTFVMQSHLQHRARGRWSKKYIGTAVAAENAQDVAFLVGRNTRSPNTYYTNQHGGFTTIENNADNRVATYSEAGANGGKWRLPDQSDLEDIKIAGFMPNRPFEYVGNNSGTISADIAPYVNWSMAKATFIDPNVISQNKTGYGNALYLYDNTNNIVWLPKNRQHLMVNYNFSIEDGLYILGATIPGTSVNETRREDLDHYYPYVTCRSHNESEPTTHWLYRIHYNNTTAKAIGTEVINIISNVSSNYISYNYGGVESYYRYRTCTINPNVDCDSPYVVGPMTGPFITCTPWEDRNDYYSNLTTKSWTYRLVYK